MKSFLILLLTFASFSALASTVYYECKSKAEIVKDTRRIKSISFDYSKSTYLENMTVVRRGDGRTDLMELQFKGGSVTNVGPSKVQNISIYKTVDEKFTVNLLMDSVMEGQQSFEASFFLIWEDGIMKADLISCERENN